MSLPQLPIYNLDQRHPGLLPSTAANYLDAARACLAIIQTLEENL
jgi:hypothetical protein